MFKTLSIKEKSNRLEADFKKSKKNDLNNTYGIYKYGNTKTTINLKYLICGASILYST